MPGKTENHLATLLRSAQKGDKNALDILCRELEKLMRGYFWQKFQKQDIVDELAQETYLRLLHSLLKIREPLKLRSFVTKIALHVSQDYLRQKYRKKEDELEFVRDMFDEPQNKQGTMIDSKDSSETILDDIDLQRALDKLSEKSRRILLMKISGYKYDEIAEDVGLSVSGVKMQVQRTIIQLQKTLSDVTFLLIVATTLLRT